MNRRIKELATDAGYPDYMTYGQDKVLEKFAELIVKECADFLTDDLDYPDAALKLKERFGVEE